MSTVTSSTSGTMSADLLAAVNPKAATAAEDSIALTQERFIKLLTTQLQNQDPLNPVDNAEMTSQMAQISTVNGLEKLNKTLETLLADSQAAQALQAAGLVGHGVLVPGEGLQLADGIAFGGFELASGADAVSVEVRDANGLLLRTLDLGAQDAGVHGFAWDGLTAAGASAAAGKYTFKVNAIQDSEAVTTTALGYGTVDGLVREAGSYLVSIGALGKFSTSDIRMVM